MTTDELPIGDYFTQRNAAYIAQLEADLAAARADNEVTSQALHQALVAKDDLWDEAQRYVIERDAARAEAARLKKKVQEAYYEGFVDAQAYCVGRFSHGSPDVAWTMSNARKNL